MIPADTFISIIVPVYKVEKYLGNCIESVQNQSYKYWELLLVDDGSPDKCGEICDEYASHDERIVVVHQPNGGQANARNHALDKCKGDYVTFLDSDDMFYPRAVEVLYHEAKSNLADLVFSDFVIEREHKPPVFIKSDTIPCQWLHGKAYRVQYLKDIGLRFPDLRTDEDSYFNLVAHNCTRKKFYVKEDTYLWRDNKNSITRSEEDQEFFKKDYINYVWTQKHGLMDIVKIRKEMTPWLCAVTLIHMYDTLMRARHFKLDVDEVENDLWELWQIPELSKCADDIKFWETIQKHLKACNMVGEDFYFYQMRFIDWFNQIIRRV